MVSMPQTDITFKELFGKDLQPLLELLLPEGIGPLQVVELNPELPATLRRVDLLVRGVCRVVPNGPMCDRLLALDWQVQYDSELPATMVLRMALAFFKYRVRVTTLLLAATRAASSIDTRLVVAEHARGELEHDVLLIKLFEQDAERALARETPELWVLATVMLPAGGDRAELLARVQDRIAKAPELSAETRQRLVDFAVTFATLELDKEAAQALVTVAQRRSQRMLDLRQSGYAQMLLAEGEAKGEAKGKAEGRVEGEAKGEAKGLAEAISAILEARRIPLSQATRTKMLACSNLDLLKQWLTLAIGGHDAELQEQVSALPTRAA
jgi:predicted transposase YdaD